MPDLREGIDRVRDQIATAAARAGRDPADITLVAASKTRAPEEIAAVVMAGVEHVGENRVQEAAQKVDRVRELLGRDPTWHLIGTLQRNKCRQALDLFGMIQSVDSVRLAQALAARAEGNPVSLLLEIYFGDDPGRPGFRPDDVSSALDSITALPDLRVCGLMTVAPLGLSEAETRGVFRRTRELRDALQARHPDLTFHEISMGMSEDFGIAVEEGATMVRVGRAIFGERG